MKLTETTIRNLIEKGASRWTKGDHDRLYLNGAAKEIVGLKTTHYKSGNISSATLKGESISNNRAGKISDIICSAYIDLTTGKLYGRVRGEPMNLLRTALEDLIESEKAQDSTPEPSAAPAIDTDVSMTVQEATEAVKKEKEVPTMKKPLSNPVFIRYYAFANEPFAFDAEGYVDASALKDMYKNDWYTRQEGDDTVARKGYKLVSDGTDMWAVKENDIYTVVYEEPALTNGYGLAYPAGGMTSTCGYDLETEIDGERVLLQRSNW